MTRRAMSQFFQVATVVGVLAAPAARVAAAPLYSITDLGTLPGTSQSIAKGINASGQVVGVSYNQITDPQGFPNPSYDPGARSFLYSNGVMTQIEPVGGLANAINDAGQVVGGANVAINNAGQYISNESNAHGLWHASSGVVDLGASTVPTAMNDAGQVVGYWLTRFGQRVPALFNQNGQMSIMDGWRDRVLGPPYAPSSIPAINQKGEMLLNIDDRSGHHSYILQPNGLVQTDLTRLVGGADMTAKALNNIGQVVGGSLLYSGGEIHPLANLIPNSSSWSNLNATAINDKGQIAGQGTIDGQSHAFLMTPLEQQVPEPGPLALAAMIVVALGAKKVASRIRRRR